jgi:hypothetical protein
MSCTARLRAASRELARPRTGPPPASARSACAGRLTAGGRSPSSTRCSSASARRACSCRRRDRASCARARASSRGHRDGSRRPDARGARPADDDEQRQHRQDGRQHRRRLSPALRGRAPGRVARPARRAAPALPRPLHARDRRRRPRRVLELAEEELDRIRFSRGHAGEAETLDELFDRIVALGEGWEANDVAVAMRVTGSIVRRARRERGRDQEKGKPVEDSSGLGRDERRRRVLKLKELGRSDREIQHALGIPYSTVAATSERRRESEHRPGNARAHGSVIAARAPFEVHEQPGVVRRRDSSIRRTRGRHRAARQRRRADHRDRLRGRGQCVARARRPRCGRRCTRRRRAR